MLFNSKLAETRVKWPKDVETLFPLVDWGHDDSSLMATAQDPRLFLVLAFVRLGIVSDDNDKLLSLVADLWKAMRGWTRVGRLRAFWHMCWWWKLSARQSWSVAKEIFAVDRTEDSEIIARGLQKFLAWESGRLEGFEECLEQARVSLGFDRNWTRSVEEVLDEYRPHDKLPPLVKS